jgi:hypothetical protein
MVAVAVLALPGAALAHGGDGQENASKLCKSLKAQMGAQPFTKAYGSNHNRHNAHGKCVSRHRHAVKRLIAAAVEQCKADLRRTAEPDKRASFRECVKQKLAAMLAARRAAFESALAKCKAEWEADAAAFREKYGSRRHGRHAFARCVSKTARAELEAQPQAQV